MEYFLIFAIPEGIVYFIFVLLLGVTSSGILNVILALIGFGVNVLFVCLFADALFSIFGEKEYSKILQLLISGAVLVWCFSFIFNSWTNEKVVKYETVNECPIAEVTEGYNYNKLPLAEVSKNVSAVSDGITSNGRKSTITRRSYGCYKYLYVTASSENYKIFVDDEEVYGETVWVEAFNTKTYKYDIKNGDYIQIKNTKKKELKIKKIKLFRLESKDRNINRYLCFLLCIYIIFNIYVRI